MWSPPTLRLATPVQQRCSSSLSTQLPRLVVGRWVGWCSLGYSAQVGHGPHQESCSACAAGTEVPFLPSSFPVSPQDQVQRLLIQYRDRASITCLGSLKPTSLTRLQKSEKGMSLGFDWNGLLSSLATSSR